MKRKMEARLLEWKHRMENRKPLLVNGARQVGKTYLLREFGEKYFKNTVYINLEVNRQVRAYFEENLEPEKLLLFLEAVAGEKIIPQETLIILDEIQACEKALTSLKYFYEEMPEYHIAAAGSLLGVAINRNEYSFPVGKVETMELFPMDFEEFLGPGKGIYSLPDPGLFWRNDCHAGRTPCGSDGIAQKIFYHRRYAGGGQYVSEYGKASGCDICAERDGG